jgi:hypothetical protein
MQPEYWKHFVDENGLVDTEVEVPPEADLSGLGIELEFLDAAGTRVEAEELYPGIGVYRDGFIPVGGCAFGSGDPYFINVNDGENGPLYRIYHDAVGDENYDRSQAVAVVLKDYRELLAYAPGRRTRR